MMYRIYFLRYNIRQLIVTRYSICSSCRSYYVQNNISTEIKDCCVGYDARSHSFLLLSASVGLHVGPF